MAAVAKIVAARREASPVVVTSAMSGVTNELVRLSGLVRAQDRGPLDDAIEALSARHVETATRLAPGDESLVQRVESLLRELRVLARGLRLVGTTTPRSLDALLGFGELLAQELLVAAMRREEVDAVVVDSRRVVVTDDAFGSARPDMERTRKRAAQHVLPELKAGRIPVLGGYMGATDDGVPTTLGRGGSDLSASLLGLALDAEAIEIWTDVDGLMTADPRQVNDARLVEEVTFREAAQFAAYGAKVLHPASIDPAVQGGVPVIVRNSLRPERPGTRIGPSGRGADEPRAIVSKSGLCLLTLRAPGRLRETGFLPEVVAGLENAGAPPFQLATGPVGIEAIIAEGSEEQAVAWLEGLGRVRSERGLGMVCVVGEALQEDPERWSRVLSIAAPHRCLRVFMGPQGATLGLLVQSQALGPLVQELHEQLIVRSKE